MQKLSAFIIAYNEEQKILAALESVSFCDEVLVVDSGSSDNTVDICRRFGARVIQQSWLGYAGQKQFALERCSYDFCLNIDADERVTPLLQAEITALLQRGNLVAAYEIIGRNEFLGALVPNFMRHEYHVRLFNRLNVSYDTDKLVHESVSVNGAVLRMQHCIEHKAKETIAIFQADLDRYSSLRAIEKSQLGKKSSLLKLCLIFPLTFLKKYFLQRAFIFGRRGFILATMESYYAFLKEAKLCEFALHNNLDQ